MSALPKKKLCWNCEGNVIVNVDNCPYCGVYLHAAELEENSSWNPVYHSTAKIESVASTSPPNAQPDSEEKELMMDAADANEEEASSFISIVSSQLKTDVIPLLFLMGGSVFFLFGIIVLLFSHNGTFTLQWQERDSLYFLLFAAPLIGFGWHFLQNIKTTDSD